MVETNNKLSKNEIIKNELVEMGYVKKGSSFEKAFLECSLINNDNSPYSLQLIIHKNHISIISFLSCGKIANYIMSGVSSIMNNESRKEKSQPAIAVLLCDDEENSRIILNTNISGIKHLEEVFSILGFPGFFSSNEKRKKMEKIMSSSEADFLSQNGFSLGYNESENSVIGDLAFGHVEHSKIKKITNKNKSYVPYEWKVFLKFDEENIFINPEIVKSFCNQVIDNYGSPKYQQGERRYLKRNPIVFRTNHEGIGQLASFLKECQQYISSPTGQ